MPLSRAPVLISIQVRPSCSGSHIQASSVAINAVPNTAHGTERLGTARGANTVIIETRLKTASAASNQSIVKPL